MEWTPCFVLKDCKQSQSRLYKGSNSTKSAVFYKRDVIGQIRVRTEKFKASFYPHHCLSEWNKLKPEIRLVPSVAVFKKKLLSVIRPPPLENLFMGSHNPKGLSFLTQLRVSLSKLNFQKFKHKVRDGTNPMCPTNYGTEDMEHFLLLCHCSDTHRPDLLARICGLL